MSKERSMCIDALFEAERNNVPFTEVTIRYNYGSGEIRILPMYNSWGRRNLW